MLLRLSSKAGMGWSIGNGYIAGLISGKIISVFGSISGKNASVFGFLSGKNVSVFGFISEKIVSVFGFTSGKVSVFNFLWSQASYASRSGNDSSASVFFL